MLNPRLYSPENLARARYAQMGVAVVTALVCGYLAFSCFTSVRVIWHARQALDREKQDSRRLAAQAQQARRLVVRNRGTGREGVESFAVNFARWARSRDVSVESLMPEGTPSATEITVGNAKLGVWNATKVRVRGQGGFDELMSLMNEFRSPGMPVQLESFALRSASGARGASAIAFDLVLTVYEKKT